MAVPVILDLLRLFLRAAAPGPRGIDRVDLAYARFLFTQWPTASLGLLPTPWGLRLYDRAHVLRGLDALEALWGENEHAAQTDIEALARRLRGDATDLPAGRAQQPRFWGVPRMLHILQRSGLSVGASTRSRAATNGIYLNIGQLGWSARWMTGWLRHRPDIRAVFMLHDAIPLERPDLVSPLGAASHRRMAAVAARRADALIFTTQAAGCSVLRAWPQASPPPARTIALHLPVPPGFLAPAPVQPALAGLTYFVVVGAIERRKNLLLLLDVWRDLLHRRGAGAPRLVIAGAPSPAGRAIHARLVGCTELRGHVIVASGLPSPIVRALLAQARALLMPSWAEGFGLPIVEALTLGTPVLASDLPAHREIAGPLGLYLHPDDRAGWLQAIERLSDSEDVALRQRIAAFRPMTAAAYFARIGAFLEEVGDS